MHLHLSERGLRQFGYTQTITQHSCVFTVVQISTQDIDKKWLNFAYHLVRLDKTISGPSSCAACYMEWYFSISHMFVLSINKGHIPIVQPMIQDMRHVSESSTQHNLVYVSNYVINIYSTFLWNCYIDTLIVYAFY